MNNYTNTQKFLKRWLKTKIKVTVATVVGFLIAGTVTFAAGEAISQTEGEKIYDNVSITEVGKQPDGTRQNGISLVGETTGTFNGNDLKVEIKDKNITDSEIAGVVIRNGATGIFNAANTLIDVSNVGKSDLWGYGLLVNSNNGLGGKAEFNGGGDVTINNYQENYTSQTLTAKQLAIIDFNNTGNVNISSKSDFAVTAIDNQGGKITFNNDGNVNISGEISPGTHTGFANVVGIQSGTADSITEVTEKVNDFNITLTGAGVDNDGTSYSTGTKAITQDTGSRVNINSKNFNLKMNIASNVEDTSPDGHTANEAYGLETREGFWVDPNTGNGEYWSGGEINISENTSTKIEINQGLGTAYGVYVSGDGSAETGKPGNLTGEIDILSSIQSQVNIAGNAVIHVTAREKSYALFCADGGLITVGGENKLVQITGDINAENLGEISLNLGTEDSFIDGAVTNNKNTDAGTITLGMNNRATWTNTKDSFINDLTLNGGIIESAENNIEVTDNFSVSGGENNINIKTFTVNSGIINSGATLENNGTFKVGEILTNSGTINVSSGTIDLSSDGKLTNENGANINVSSGATAVTGGKTINNGFISLLDTDSSDGNISGLLKAGTLLNSGTIALSDKSGTMTDEEWNSLLANIVTDNGTFTNTGMIVDTEGNSIFSEGTVIEGNTSTGELIDNGLGEDGAIKIEDGKDIIISGTKTENETGEEATLKDVTINVEGNLTLAGKNTENSTNGILMEDLSMNVENEKSVTILGTENNLTGDITLNGTSKLIVSDNADLTFSGSISGGEENLATIEIGNGALNLVDTTVGVEIEGENGTLNSLGDTSLKNINISTLNIGGDDSIATHTTTIDGEIRADIINIGIFSTSGLFSSRSSGSTNTLALSSSSKFTKDTTISIGNDGSVLLGIGSKITDGKYSENAFGNSSSAITVNGEGKVILNTSNLSGTNPVIGLGNITADNTNFITDSDIYLIDENDTDLSDGLSLKYTNILFGENSPLNQIGKEASVLAGILSTDLSQRESQLDKIYASNIYSETVRAAYDNIKLNEEAVESLARKSTIGKWTAEGKALYSKNEYDREGTLKDYSSEIESTGLMAAFGYGINETTTAGIALSGVKQDVDTDGGSADADLFYLGVYGNKAVGNYDFTAGLGYQFGEYDADNTVANVHGSDKYDSQAVSGYVQGRYTADLGDGLSVQPKVRLGYTYIDQDNAKDSYFGVSDAEISTFDAEVGFDIVKSIQLEKTKIDIKFGTSYIKVMGDTDEKFEGRFYGADETSNRFDVLGAELAENTVKFNLGAEITNENGFFCNGGFTYEFGSNNTEVYGVHAGVGYKF